MKLSSKIFITLGIGALICAIVVASFIFISTRTALEKEIGDRQMEFARQTMARIDQHLAERMNSIQILANLETVRQALQSVGPTDAVGNTARANASLGGTPAIKSTWEDIRVLALDGRKVASSEAMDAEDSAFAGSDAFHDLFKEAIKGSVVSSEVFLSGGTGGPEIVFMAPVRQDGVSGPVIGVITGSVRFDAFAILLGDVRGIAIHLFNREGLLIGTDDTIHSGEFLSATSHQAYAHLLAGGHKGVFLLDSAGEYKGETLVSLVEEVPVAGYAGKGWFLTAETPAEAAFAGATRTAVVAVVVVSSLVFLMMVLIYIFMYRITVQPLRELREAADAIAGGDLARRVSVADLDEHGLLAQAFNLMAEKLQASYAGLEVRVSAKTAELAKALADAKLGEAAMESLAKELEKFKLAVEYSTNHIIITDKDGVIVYANRAAEDITGFTREEMMGKKAGSKELWGGLMPRSFYDALWKVLRDENKPFTGEIRNHRKNGETYDAAVSIAPIFGEGGSVKFYVGVERDITKEKQVDRAKTEFVSLASHQLRTPLTVINWYTEMLLSESIGKLNTEQTTYLREVSDAAYRLVALVNALLNVSRIDLGTFAVEPKPIDITVSADTALLELGPQIAFRRVKLEKRYDEHLPIMNADPDLMHIIFQNLLSNAVKYTPPEGLVKLDIARRNTDIIITVSDTGYGIPAAQQGKIFTKLFRADNAKLREMEGNGLGLYIVKSIVDAAGGKIGFVSEENKGTTFTVELPIAGMQKKEGATGLK